MRKSVLFVVASVLAASAVAADSLDCRLVGNWPFGPATDLALDPARNLVFCASGGAVYVLDVSKRCTKSSVTMHGRRVLSLHPHIYALTSPNPMR